MIGPDTNAGGQRIGPGSYIGSDGALHFSVPEILDHFGLPDTEENREQCLAMVQKACRQLLPDAKQRVTL